VLVFIREKSDVTYVIGEPCIDVMDRACVEECPVDCGACEPVCPVEAIYTEDDARFFTETLAGRDAPLGSPGGAAKLGAIDADTELVAAHPRAAE
jgi:NAD-dependent dihydropyrimidine dehydrogenase PreA subunit